MSQDDPEGAAAAFTGLVDLAAAGLGGRALGASDEFFAGADNLLQPGRGVFIEGKFTEQGKWMDGWESRRRRVSPPDHDWCVLALGAPGVVAGFDVDTHHFVGNHPPFASIDGLLAPGAATLDELTGAGWDELLAQAPLRPGSQNLFGARPRGPVSHVRLNIFPDGGVARLRVFGRVAARWDAVDGGDGHGAGVAGDARDRDEETRRHVGSDLRDLAAVKNGGLALACSDAFFGPMNNLLLPGRAENMGGGWETRRRRGPGHDWILIALGARGLPEVVEIDTNHFKGNYPDRCSLEVIDAPDGARITDLLASPRWAPLLPETRLGPHARHFFADLGGGGRAGAGSASAGGGRAPVTHLRLNVFPDGGISRLRVWGRRP
jgi:allantoicase